jgi:iron complex transport system permease protein
VTAAPARPATRSRTRLLGGLALALIVAVLVVVLSLAVGSRSIEFGAVLAALFGAGTDATDRMVVLDLRVPRTLIGVAAGAALALAGGLMQGLTRNPLADPGLLGVSAGASLFVVLAISWFGVTAASGYVWFALAGAAVATALVYLVGSVRGGPSPLTLTLSGSAVTAGVTSVITLILIGDLETLGQYRFWSVGSLVGRDLEALAQVTPVLAVGVVLALLLGRGLDLLALGDDVARGLGQRVGLTRVLAASAIVLLCGGATAVAGPLAFVGLVVPHVARRITGPDYRWILAYSVVLGPILVLLADVAGRFLVRPAELEAGLVVAVVGAPVMIALIRGSRAGNL